MGLPILNNLLPLGIQILLNVQPCFLTFTYVLLVMGMVTSILASYPLLTQSILDMFPGAKFYIEQLFKILL